MGRKLAWMALGVIVVAGLAPWGKAQEGSPASASAGRPAGLTGQPASRPAARPGSTTQPANPEVAAEELIRSLLTERPQQPVRTPAGATSAPASRPAAVAPEGVIQPIASPGTMIVSRLGRLVRDPKSEWWMFHFESEKNVLREPPIRILPNRLLESMEKISEEGAKAGIRFIISGEVTEYHGAKYVLLRQFVVDRDLGAL